MGEVLVNAGFALVSGGTDTHLILLDLRPKKLTGNISEKALGRAHITCNKNGVPFDPEKPMVTSGVRLGAPAGTTRGFGVAEFQEIGRMIAEVLGGLAQNGEAGNSEVENKVKAQAIDLCKRFPIYS
jgi:glycine hydroxymethyltransferase